MSFPKRVYTVYGIVLVFGKGEPSLYILMLYSFIFHNKWVVVARERGRGKALFSY